MKHLVSES